MGHSLDQEDPLIYTREDREGVALERQWPDIPLPSADQEEGAAPSVNPALLKKALNIHHMYVEYLKGLGVDPCKEYNAQNVEYLIEAVVTGDKKCSVCGHKSYNAQRLRAHMRAKHLEVTPYQCKHCSKYLADKATLTLHEKRHSSANYTHPCDECEKAFTSLSRLTEHKKVHLPGNQNIPCRFCGKEIKERKNLKQHESLCKDNKTSSKAARVKCPFCPKDYAQPKDMYRHADQCHKGRDARRAFKEQQQSK